MSPVPSPRPNRRWWATPPTDGATLDTLADEGYGVVSKVPPARNGTGGFTKDRFDIDLGRRPQVGWVASASGAGVAAR